MALSVSEPEPVTDSEPVSDGENTVEALDDPDGQDA